MSIMRGGIMSGGIVRNGVMHGGIMLSQRHPIAALFARLGGTGFFVDPLDHNQVWADTAGTLHPARGAPVARLDAGVHSPVAASFTNGTIAQQPILRADGEEYDGIDDRLVCPDDPALRFGTTDFTLAAAVKPNDLRVNNRFFNKNPASGSGAGGKWGLFLNASDLLATYDFSGKISSQNVVVISGIASIGSWTDAIVSLDRANAQWLPYANGASYSPVAIPGSEVGDISNTSPVYIGAAAAVVFFYGTIGRCLAIDKLLSDSDRAIVNDWLNAGHA